MADISELLSSISDEDMAKIQSVAQSLMNNQKHEEPKKNASGMFDDGTVNRLMSVMGQFNREDERTRLINDLKPLLSDERRKKADDAIKFLRLMEMLPLLKGMFQSE